MVSAPKVTANWKSSFVKDPFDVPVDNKIEFLLKLNEAALAVKGVSFVNSSMAWVNEQKFLATSDGSRIEQYLIAGNPSFSVTATDRATGDFQARNSLREGQSIGYEYMEKHDWIGEANEAAEEAVMKLKPKPSSRANTIWFCIRRIVFDDSRIRRASYRTRPRASLGSQLRRDEFFDTGQNRKITVRLENQ
jgi:predicted Zn-dependent protease